jgi:hypothetical protein
VQAHLAGVAPDPVRADFPSIADGVRGMRFIEKVIASGKSKSKWVRM